MSYEQDREDSVVNERFLDRESTADECNEAIMLGAEQEEALECEECGHAVSAHNDRYGCQVERGDAWVDGESMGAWMAQGPCGCKAHGEEFRAMQKALEAYAAAVKQFGKAFIQLGRSCD